MIQINLLPVREIKRRIKAKRQITFLSICFCCFLLLLGVVGYLQFTRVSFLKSEVKRLETEKGKYSKILAEIKKLEDDKKLLETRIGIIKNLKKSTSLTVHVLDEVANLTPSNRMWLTNLTQDDRKLMISGMALDNQTIAKYMDDLDSSLYINSVSLSESSINTYAERSLKKFSISCAVSVPNREQNNDVVN